MYLLCYFLKLIGTGARQGGGVDSGIRFRGDSESIRRCRPFPVHVTAAKGRKGRRNEGTGRKGGGENNTAVKRGTRGSLWWWSSGVPTRAGHHHHHPGFLCAATMKKIAAAASKALRTLHLQLWDSARAALIESRRWINAAMSKITRRNN